jgi:FtsP/CotA-like multicopper oxidase with cupredoxin domain
MRRNQTIIGPGHYEYCRKDVVALYPGDTVEYWVTATDYVGVYPMHCHNVVHEDGGMMVLFRVDDIGDTNPQP